jgi:hypothetical protein
MSVTHAVPVPSSDRLISAGVARPILCGIVGAAVLAGLFATDPAAATAAVAQAGDDLTRLLRAMALIKAGLGALAVAGVWWRFGGGVGWLWFTAYGLACAAMAAGPALIWRMDHVVSGSVLLHGGLFGLLLLLWRDPDVARRLSALIAARRQRRI